MMRMEAFREIPVPQLDAMALIPGTRRRRWLSGGLSAAIMALIAMGSVLQRAAGGSPRPVPTEALQVVEVVLGEDGAFPEEAAPADPIWAAGADPVPSAVPEGVPEVPPEILPAAPVPAPVLLGGIQAAGAFIPAPGTAVVPGAPGAPRGGGSGPGTGVEGPRFDAAYLKNPPPEYPAQSRRLKEEGQVVLRILVSPEGRPLQVEVRGSSGSERLDRAARAAVERWMFQPARRDNEAIAAWVVVPIVFTLEA